MTSSDSPAGRTLGGLLLGATAVVAAACASSGTGSSTATVTVTPAGLRVSKGASNGGAGTTFTSIDFTNTSGSACVIEGYPGVSLVSTGSNAGRQVGADAKRTTTTPVHPITLGSGQTAHAVLGVAEAGNFPAAKCNPVTAHWLKAFPPGQRAAAYVSFTTQTCASTAEPTMTIAAIISGP